MRLWVSTMGLTSSDHMVPTKVSILVKHENIFRPYWTRNSLCEKNTFDSPCMSVREMVNLLLITHLLDCLSLLHPPEDIRNDNHKQLRWKMPRTKNQSQHIHNNSPKESQNDRPKSKIQKEVRPYLLQNILFFASSLTQQTIKRMTRGVDLQHHVID